MERPNTVHLVTPQRLYIGLRVAYPWTSLLYSSSVIFFERIFQVWISMESILSPYCAVVLMVVPVVNAIRLLNASLGGL